MAPYIEIMNLRADGERNQRIAIAIEEASFIMKTLRR